MEMMEAEEFVLGAFDKASQGMSDDDYIDLLESLIDSFEQKLDAKESE